MLLLLPKNEIVYLRQWASLKYRSTLLSIKVEKHSTISGEAYFKLPENKVRVLKPGLYLINLESPKSINTYFE
jgi:hypothetical protein